MYDLATSAVLFFLLVPGILVTLPPGGSVVMAAIVHAVVFWVVQRFLSQYVPWWAIWIVGLLVAGGRFYFSQAPTSTF